MVQQNRRKFFAWMQIKQAGLKSLALFCLGVGLVSAIALYPLTASALVNQATVQEILDGDQVFIEEVQAEVDAVAKIQQSVSTKDARAGLLFNNGSVGRLGPNSSLTIGQCIEVKQGILLASGPANGCTATFDIGIQGTIYVMEVNAQGEAQVKVLEGELTINPKASDSSTANEPIAVKAGEKIQISPEGVLGTVAELLQSDVESILNGVLFQGFNLELPGTAELQAVLESLYPDLELPRLPGFNLPVPSVPSSPLPF